MEYVNAVQTKLALINRILASIAQNDIFTNDLVRINKVLNFDDYLDFDINNNGVVLFFIVSASELTIYIDRAREVYDFSSAYVESEEETVSEIISAVFTCKMRIEYFGRHKTTITIVNRDSTVFASLKFSTGISFILKPTKTKLVGPCFGSEN